MSFEQLIFYLFSVTLVAAGISMVTVRNPVYAALSLIVCFFTSAALWLLLEAEFLGIVLVLVYVGAVMVLFLFVIMMLDLNLDLLKEGFARYLPVGFLVAAVVAVEMILVVNSGPFQATVPAAPAAPNNTEALGALLYTEYVYPFEIAAVILVVAIIAAIVLTLRRRPDSRKQDVSQQVQVRREDRVRLVKMKSERSE
ncbi:NADH-quinone oxidoreductase subunit J [Thiothrix nivea]|uniref:NADH-quinone oxidoreductase subunit J n=1 Tax=Thiothrix nivea (strain ATCC 35100 / DSM 5205 / JP2) TaxID=870187 RepID=A0A656HDI9_THINJ|nr:NADH-quinone oxidoreductase subunit J [Thiothrix nivea]EIJ34044.1 NADH dehydrogenase subunit J [Thiothrix nivea DSM 5205]